LRIVTKNFFCKQCFREEKRFEPFKQKFQNRAKLIVKKISTHLISNLRLNGGKSGFARPISQKKPEISWGVSEIFKERKIEAFFMASFSKKRILQL